MEKKCQRECSPRGSIAENLLRMKLVTFLVLATMVTSLANSNSQTTKINLLSLGMNSLTSAVPAEQSKEIKGKVTDVNGDGIPGVSVVIAGTTNGTVTDFDGNYVLRTSEEVSTLVFSFVGMQTKEVALENKTAINVTMEDETIGIDEVQVIAYGTQKKVTITGSISSVEGADLLKAPVASLGNALVGKLSGVTAVQFSGEPGADNPDIFVRGQGTLNSNSATPLILVDGVERDFTQIDPNEVDNITVLKDASSTAVFGVRGANGVILITTKRGKEGKAKISMSSSVGVQVPTRLLEFANSHQYASYYNEAQLNDGVDAENLKYKPDVLQAFKDHSNPLIYPDVDWMDMVLKPASMQSQHNMNISGGTEKVRYFVSLGALTQEGLFRTFDSGYDFNFDYKRYNYRANLDIDVTESTMLSINLGGYVSDKNTPISNEDQNQLFRQLYWATPFAGAGIVDGKWIKTNSDYIDSPGSDGLDPYYGKGYNSRINNSLNVDLMLQQKLDFITEGLYAKLKGSYNTNYTHNKQRSSSIPSYTTVINDEGEVVLRKSGDDAQLGFSESFGSGRNWYTELSLNYARKIGAHNFSALALYNQSKTYYPATYTDIPSGYIGMVGRVTYDYLTRYMFDVNVGYNGSENFAPGKRYGLFPAFSAGWILSEEAFMQNQNVIDYLKIRGSYGIVGNDRLFDGGTALRFLYLPNSYVLGGDGYNFGTNVSGNQPGAYEGNLNNQEVTWEKEYKQNYGLDVSFLDDRLKFSGDIFFNRREDILIRMNSIPGYLGMSLPPLNKGIVENKGYELTLKWDDAISSDFKYWFNGNLSFARNKIIEQDEVPPSEDYMWRTGNPVGQPFVRSFWGFYDETANDRYHAQYGTDIAEHAGGLHPGDAVYIDLNEDGVIDSDDISAQGYTNNPEYSAGFTIGFMYKNFDFSMLVNTAWNTSRLLEETFRDPLGETRNRGLLLSQYENRWTPETAATATLPRASFTSRTNNTAGSTLFLVDASYVRLKNIEMGYNLDFPFMETAKISSLRLFANGYNLITIDKLNIADPESRTSSRPAYPLTKVFNIGVKVGF
jgi:TonB-linked SusC/RagA family outer membrane protein